ncbi:arsenate reductase ArsC [Facklamia sp. P12945]|uniref:arsenate reductase ArsC n=1 Tax=unclassified Facklamia TaxID=2622293 RepID=UPI003D166C71
MKKVAFVCVHNSCRSQIAEALAKRYGQGVIEAYSAGTEEKDQINQEAVRLMKDIYQIDMEANQQPKLITELAEIDYLITMGCNVNCPFLPFNDRKEDWGLEDPSGKSDEAFKEVIASIDQKVKELVAEISQL